MRKARAKNESLKRLFISLLRSVMFICFVDVSIIYVLTFFASRSNRWHLFALKITSRKISETRWQFTTLRVFRLSAFISIDMTTVALFLSFNLRAIHINNVNLLALHIFPFGNRAKLRCKVEWLFLSCLPSDIRFLRQWSSRNKRNLIFFSCYQLERSKAVARCCKSIRLSPVF